MAFGQIIEQAISLEDHNAMTRRFSYYVCVALSALALTACSKPPAPPPDIRPVRAEQVGSHAAATDMQFAGDVHARHEADLAFRVGGRVSARRVELGSAVFPGQVIATIDPADYALAASAAQSQLSAARAEAQLAQQDLRRYAQLRDQHFISEAEYERRKTTLDSNQARVRQLNADAVRQGNQRSYTSLVSPFAGVVTRVAVEPGVVVAPGQVVAQVAQLGEMEVMIHVPENELGKLNLGDTLAVHLWSAADAVYRGRLRELSPIADPATRTYVARVTLLNPDSSVRLGMTATVDISSTAAPGLSVPQTALYRVSGQTQVWIVDRARGTVALRTVRLGALAGDHATIAAGLTAGEWVVTAGVHKLASGQTVKLLKPAAVRP
jgi:multidrug efflux system membrane fusion protein